MPYWWNYEKVTEPWRWKFGILNAVQCRAHRGMGKFFTFYFFISESKVRKNESYVKNNNHKTSREIIKMNSHNIEPCKKFTARGLWKNDRPNKNAFKNNSYTTLI